MLQADRQSTHPINFAHVLSFSYYYLFIVFFICHGDCQPLILCMPGGKITTRSPHPKEPVPCQGLCTVQTPEHAQRYVAAGPWAEELGPVQAKTESPNDCSVHPQPLNVV